MLDIDFIKYIYQPIINNKKLTNDSDIIDYSNNNPNTIIYTCVNDFVNKNKFDYVFYSNYYGLVGSSEMTAIYHYINYGIYFNYKTNIHDVKDQDNLSTDIDDLSVKHIIGKTKKILLVTHEMSLTGGSLIIYDIYNFYKKRNYNIDLLNLNPSVNLIKNFKNLNFYDINSYDLIVVNTIANNVIEWCENNIQHIDKFILWLHETDQIYYTDKFKKIFFKIVICDSYYVRKIFMENYAYTNTLIKVLYLCNDKYILKKNYSKINKNNLRKMFNIDDNSIVFLNIGTVCTYKNQITIIKTIEKYMCKKNKFLNIKFIFIGTDNYLTNYIKKSPYANTINKYVLFLPQVSNNKCYKYYALADVYINCTHDEPYGRVLIESMEWSCPIIAYRGGSHLELIQDNFNGLLYSDYNELWDKIIFFYNNKNLIKKYGKNGNILYKKKIQNINNFYLQISSIFSLILNNKYIPNISYENVYTKHIHELNLLECHKFTYQNNLYIYGGYKNNSTSCNNNIYKLNLFDNSIVNIAKIPDDCATTHVTLIQHNENVLIISGQIGELFGKATNTFYVYNITSNKFEKKNNVPFALYTPVCILNQNMLTIFSGTTENRTTPNTIVWRCIIIDEFDNIINNPTWFQYTTFTGTTHSSIISTNIPNEYYYLGGCGCHTCSMYSNEHGIYCNDAPNYKITFDKNNDITFKKIAKQNFENSHCESSIFFNNNIVYLTGGQLMYDMVFNGVQLYYTELDLWIELIISKDYLKYFNKGCICFQNNNKLYLTSGQFGTNLQKATNKFNDTLIVFDIV
jgi:glycosyltransferase involved in cell wall biosynthesis